MKPREYAIAFLVGAASGALWFFVLQRLAVLAGWELVALAVAMPFLFVAGAVLARLIFREGIAARLIKFLMVGVLNTGIDFFIFDLLIAATGTDRGWSITAFKSVSFLCAMVNSYELNRLWAFAGESSARRTKAEFARFFAVTVVGFLLNVGTTSVLSNAVHPLFGLSQVRWDNVAAAAATVLNLAWNFAGYRLFVFNADKSAPRTTSTTA
ncbi:MAG TPA: GtrA family protein [Candidatus Paceibacterota bacterium]|nr:GtrA family protein [Candidatus Paceibacterota bacterium]